MRDDISKVAENVNPFQWPLTTFDSKDKLQNDLVVLATLVFMLAAVFYNTRWLRQCAK